MSLIEVVMSTLLVGVVLVGAMNLLGAVVRGRTKAADMARGQQLAQQLMTEILSNAYSENGNFGPNLIQPLIPEVRSQFNDVDDYDPMDETPLATRSGSIIPNTAGWRQFVDVTCVDADDPETPILPHQDQGLKRITVTIQRSGQTVAQLTCLRSDKYPPLPLP